MRISRILKYFGYEKVAKPEEAEQRKGPSSSRRMRRYAITPEALLHTFTHGTMIGVEEGIPPGARCCGLIHDRMSNCIFLFVEHPMFESRMDPFKELPEGPPVRLKDMRETFSEMQERLDKK